MAIAEDNVRVQSIIDRKLADKITELGERLGVSQSKMVYYLLEAAVEDEEWIIKTVTSKFAQKIYAAFGRKLRSERTGKGVKKPDTA